jgi:glycosyltransferase involved in cell wall biosynthesis
MRLLYVIDGLGFGGAERSLAELLPIVRENGIEPIVACLFERPGGVERDVREAGFDVRILPDHAVRRVAELRRVIRDSSPTLIHTSLLSASFAGRFAAVGTGVPVLTSLVSESYPSERRNDPHARPVALRGIRAADRFSALHMTTHFHAITHAAKASAVRALGLPSERITVVERGRDPSRLGVLTPERRDRVRAELGAEADTDVIVAVGRQEYVKGHRFLVHAMPAIRTARPGTVLWIAGRPGEETPYLRDLVRRAGLDGSVRFLGHRDDIADVLCAADVFVFPSLWEGLGGALIEAMALGLPIAASAVSAVEEVTEHGIGAVLVPPAAPAELAVAVASLLARRARAAELGRAAREIFFRRFTLDHSAERMIALYRGLVGSGARHPGEYDNVGAA